MKNNQEIQKNVISIFKNEQEMSAISGANQPPQFSIDQAYQNLEDFLFRGKIVRDIIIKQCI